MAECKWPHPNWVKSEIFPTPYLYLASYLKTLGYELLKIRVKHGQGVFMFPYAATLDRDLAAFSAGVQVNLADYLANVEILKVKLREAFVQDAVRDSGAGA
jgi:hypothetical protein